MSTTFFTSDLHFGHARIIELCGRPFASADEMDRALIARWNDVVAPEDTVWVLGDYALGNRHRALGYLPELNGRKLLVIGNHDACDPLSSDGWKKVGEYTDAGFAAVLPWARFKLPPVAEGEAGRKVLLSHFPYDGDSRGADRHVQARLRDLGEVLLHGHVHQEFRVRRSRKSGAVQVNVGVDRWDYAPVSAATLATLVTDVEAGRVAED